MRRTTKTGLLITLFSLYSFSAFGGQVAVCEEIKNDPAYKGLYGLCNAYWNADEEAREQILRNYEKKAGPNGPPMPGLEDEGYFACPCWSVVAYDDVCALGEPFSTSLEGELVYADFEAEADEENPKPRLESFNSQSNNCAYSIQTIEDDGSLVTVYAKSQEGMLPEDGQQCRAEVLVIATLHEENICD